MLISHHSLSFATLHINNIFNFSITVTFLYFLYSHQLFAFTKYLRNFPYRKCAFISLNKAEEANFPTESSTTSGFQVPESIKGALCITFKLIFPRFFLPQNYEANISSKPLVLLQKPWTVSLRVILIVSHNCSPSA